MSKALYDPVRAWSFAVKAHEGQKRKYTGEPYIVHLHAVWDTIRRAAFNDLVQQIAILHDVLEDTPVTFEEMDKVFVPTVSQGVVWLTDTPAGFGGMNRAQRKAQDVHRLAEAPGYIQSIKVADILDNTSDILKHDPAFAKVYIPEREAMLKVLSKADPILWAQANDQIERIKAGL